MDIKKELREVAFKENDIDFLGIAPVDRFENAPEGHKPTDLLPKAQSVIVLGVKLPLGVIEANHRAYEGLRHCIFTYMLYGYVKINERLDLVALRLVRYIENKYGYKCFPIPSSVPRDEQALMGLMSNRHAAVCAGLAEFGWNGLALRPDVGPRVRWVSIVTEMELPPDPLYSGPRLCDRSTCSICIDICPLNAISRDEKRELKIGNLHFEYGVLNKMRCRCGVSGFTYSTCGRKNQEIPETMTADEWLGLSKKDNVWNKIERIASMCGRCMMMCPIGK